MKEVDAKTVKEIHEKMKADSNKLHADLDATRTEAKRNFDKGIRWTYHATKHGHYIVELYARLDATFPTSKF